MLSLFIRVSRSFNHRALHEGLDISLTRTDNILFDCESVAVVKISFKALLKLLLNVKLKIQVMELRKDEYGLVGSYKIKLRVLSVCCENANQ